MTTPSAGRPSRTDAVRTMFDALAPDYDQSGVPFFRPIAEGLVEALDPQPGARALDIGCGRGAATIALAEAVGPQGTVTAVDLSPAMAAHTEALLAAAGHAGDVRVMDAAEPDLELGGYDVVSSSLVVFFLDDPAAALRRWVGLLAPGGQIGLATFGDHDEVWTSVEEVFTPWLPTGLRDPRLLGPDSPFVSDAGMERLLRAAGAAQVRTETFDLSVPFEDAEQWRDWSMSTGQRAMWAAVPAQERDGVLAHAAQILADARGTDGRTVLTQGVRYTLGRA